MKNLNCLIVDNEITSLRNLESFIKRYSTLEVANKAFNIDEAIYILNTEKIDIIFLDVELDNEFGFNLIKKIAKENNNYLIIIYSAHKEYGVEAIRNRVFDYLLKPIDKINFVQIINNIKDELDRRKIINLQSNYDLNINTSNQLIKLGNNVFNLNNIVKIEGVGSYSKIYHLIKGVINIKILSIGLYQIKKIINNKYFIQANRNDIVNLNYLINRNEKHKSILEIKHIGQVKLSRRRKNEVIEQIQKLA